MHKTYSIIAPTITISVTAAIFLILGIQISFEQGDNAKNWIIGETDKLSFKYPNHWEVNISNSRFDDYELIFSDKASNAAIKVSDETVSSNYKSFLTANNPKGYFDIYMMKKSPLSSTVKKIEVYPKGKFSIAGLEPYSELYLDKEYAILVSLAFQKDNERHYTIIARAPSSTYDNLEPIMLEIIKSITPKTNQKQSNEKFEISSNNTNSVDSDNKQDTEQLQKEDPIERESILSNVTENNNNNISNESLINEQPQENRSLTQSHNTYEGLGIKFRYSDPWEMGLLQADEPSCLIFCITQLSSPDLGAVILIMQEKFDNPKIKNNCKCDTLLEYVKYEYENTISKYEDLVFINDNQTILTDDNLPAMQMEYENKGSTIGDENVIDKSYDIFTKGPNSFYRIVFSADKNEQYPKYINDFKEILNSLEFVSTNDTQPKQPSFMMSNGEVNESTSAFPSSSINEKEKGISEIKEGLEKSFDKVSESSESNELTILSHNSYIDSAGALHIIGEVENKSPTVAEYVEVIGTLYDNNNKIVGTSFTFTDPSDLASGEKAPFDLIITDASIPLEQIERYTLKISRQ